ncbi:hypothetical protein [Lentzea sp. NBRC 102530]|nr:hypothetical protein [Lentzea sp. NBRC 102530]GLY47892.1 hypothetical protein Lesp01_15480 [Lentzea sp. NBRC 102530]
MTTPDLADEADYPATPPAPPEPEPSPWQACGCVPVFPEIPSARKELEP